MGERISAKDTLLDPPLKADGEDKDITATNVAGDKRAMDVNVANAIAVSGPTEVTQATHDNLNANANIQVGDADVSTSNQVPVKASTDLGGLLAGLAYDYIDVSVTATTDTYAFKSGGVGGSTVGTITVTFTDSTKEQIANVAKT